ncbi:hypothetical protein SDC9_103382 [bioreactor metagenome]|uniref:Uncharacterized protein n=1 Tax=bioreactor metagenome TaxID=1076179 RepID=A0A645B087_9ZZZZ
MLLFAIPTKSSNLSIPLSSIKYDNPLIISSTILYPYCITAVVTCKLLAPNTMNSRASFQVSIPPIPLIGTFFNLSFVLICCINLNAIGLTAFPE